MENMENKVIRKEGITLLTLIVTIIILLVLAGVSLNFLNGKNGIINKTREAKELTLEAQAKESLEMAMVYIKLDIETNDLSEEDAMTKENFNKNLTLGELTEEPQKNIDRTYLLNYKINNEKIYNFEVAMNGTVEKVINLMPKDEFIYSGKKYLMYHGEGNYLVIDKDLNVTLFSKEDEKLFSIPSMCVSCEGKYMIINGTGTEYDLKYYFSKDGHCIYGITNENEEFKLACEREYCNHEGWIDVKYLNDDQASGNVEYIKCFTCGENIDFKIIGNYCYAKNVLGAATYNCDCSCFPELNGYGAWLLDNSKEPEELESYIDGVPVNFYFSAFYEDSRQDGYVLPKIPNTVKYIFLNFNQNEDFTYSGTMNQFKNVTFVILRGSYWKSLEKFKYYEKDKINSYKEKYSFKDIIIHCTDGDIKI